MSKSPYQMCSVCRGTGQVQNVCYRCGGLRYELRYGQEETSSAAPAAVKETPALSWGSPPYRDLGESRFRRFGRRHPRLFFVAVVAVATLVALLLLWLVARFQVQP